MRETRPWRALDAATPPPSLNPSHTARTERMKEAKREAEDVIKGVRAEKEKAFQATAVPVRARTSPQPPLLVVVNSPRLSALAFCRRRAAPSLWSWTARRSRSSRCFGARECARLCFRVVPSSPLTLSDPPCLLHSNQFGSNKDKVVADIVRLVTTVNVSVPETRKSKAKTFGK